MTTRPASRTRFTPTVAAAAAAMLALTLAACSTDGGTDEDPTPTGTATSDAPSPTESSEPPAETPTDDSTAPADESSDAPVPFPANTEPDLADPSDGALLTVTDIRVGQHDGYDRAVLELGGTGTPGWRVEYVDRPVGDGKGDVVDVDGDAYLQVMISGSGYPMDTGVEEYSEPNPVEGGGDGVIEEVRLLGVFEGYTQAFVGVDGEQRPFRVFALENPTRVVVDVRDDG
jgi:hypothetical protein